MILKKLDGIFSVIKPVGITSAQLCNRLREDLLKELGENESSRKALKIGHGGTLDFDAYGVLPIGLGNGCKQLHQLLQSDKRYLCHAVLGVETDTGCASGQQVQQLPYDHVTYDMVESALVSFCGNILQVPPRFSALKYKGRRLSDMAYAGESIPTTKLQPRPVTVHHLQCLQFEPPVLALNIHCSSGFYVRSLVSNLGQGLKTCAHVGSLERLQHGPFTKESSIPSFAWTVEKVLLALESSRLYLDSLQRPSMNKDCNSRKTQVHETHTV